MDNDNDIASTVFSSPFAQIAEGYFARIFQKANSYTVIKVAKAEAQPLHHIEKRIFNRIGRYPYIVQFLGECKIQIEPDSAIQLGLCFRFEPRGTLYDMLKQEDKPECFALTRER